MATVRRKLVKRYVWTGNGGGAKTLATTPTSSFFGLVPLAGSDGWGAEVEIRGQSHEDYTPLLRGYKFREIFTMYYDPTHGFYFGTTSISVYTEGDSHVAWNVAFTESAPNFVFTATSNANHPNDVYRAVVLIEFSAGGI